MIIYTECPNIVYSARSKLSIICFIVQTSSYLTKRINNSLTCYTNNYLNIESDDQEDNSSRSELTSYFHEFPLELDFVEFVKGGGMLSKSQK